MSGSGGFFARHPVSITGYQVTPASPPPGDCFVTFRVTRHPQRTRPSRPISASQHAPEFCVPSMHRVIFYSYLLTELLCDVYMWSE